MDTWDKTAAFEEPPPPAQKREIPKDHSYDPKALKPMSQTLWACSVALGHALTAYRYFTRLKSATISPDGRLGGRGYIREVSQVRKDLYDVCERLSAISDTLYDEISAPHWKPKLALLDDNEQEDVERFVEESKHVLDNPEEEAEDEIEKIEKENDGPKDTKSELPDGGDAPPQEPERPNPTKQASASSVVARFLGEGDALAGLDAQTGGPRVDNRDPMGGDGPHGSFNPQEDAVQDDWGLEGPQYDYSDLEASSQQWAQTALPSDDTPTDAWDWGLGYGARGQGAGGYANPSDEGNGKGIWGPHSGLPGAPPQSSGDTPVVDVSINERHAETGLPGDYDDPVARRDEYEGAKGNLVQTAEAWADTLPDGDNAPGEVDTGVDIDTGYVHEDLSTPWLPLTAPGTTRTV